MSNSIQEIPQSVVAQHPKPPKSGILSIIKNGVGKACTCMSCSGDNNEVYQSTYSSK